MSEPERVGDLLPALPVLRIPKRCPSPPKGCGKEYEGNALTPLKPGEERRVAPCGECIDKWEVEEKKRLEAIRDDGQKVVDVKPPRLAGEEW